ncbi:MAG: hypothetical protein WBC44_14825 [Planctomycetaceae bacterium]
MADEMPPNPIVPRDADAVRLEMANVRGTLDENVHDLVTNARNLADWRYYVKAAPWGAIGAAMAVGYFVVPRRIQIVQPDADEIAKLAKRHQIVVEHKAKAEAKQGGPAQLVMTMLANAMLRAATAYVSQQAGKVFGEQAAEKPHDQFNAEVRNP